jgi:RNA polymerase sigma-70 factor (ECF subfamily)
MSTQLRDAAWHDALCNTYAQSIMQMLARQLNGDFNLAGDLVQETFITAWRKREKVPDDPGAWLYTTARNHLQNYRRSALRHQHEPLGDHDVVDMSATSQIAEVDEHQRLKLLLNQLSATDREVILLTYIDNLNTIEIAAILAITPAAARKRLSRARRQIQKALEKSQSDRKQ